MAAAARAPPANDAEDHSQTSRASSTMGRRCQGGGPRRRGYASFCVADSAKPMLSGTAQHEASRIS